MAEKRTIELEIKENFKQVEKDLNSLDKALDNTADSARDVNKSFEDVYGDLQPLTSRMGEAEDRLYELAAAGDYTSNEYKNLLNTVGEYRKVQINTDLAVDSASMTLSQKLGGALGGVASGFELAQGSMALFGVEGENVQEALLKVQSAMALAQGLQGLKEAKSSFIALGNSAVNALKGIKTAIAATGIGLLLVAVGSLVAYWDDIKEAVSGVSDEQTNLNKKTQANLVASEAKVESLNKQDNILKLQGKTEKEILQLKITELDATIKIAEVNLANQKVTKKSQVEAAKRNHDILVGIITFMSVPLELLLKSIDKVASFIGKETGLSDWYKWIKESGANLLFDPVATATEGDAAIKEAEGKLLDMKNSKAGYELQIRGIEREARQGSVNNASGTAKEIKDIAFDLEEERIRLMKDGQQKELDSLALQYAKKKKEIEKDETILAKDKTKLLDGLINGQKSDEALINEKYRQLEKDKEISPIWKMNWGIVGY